MNLTKKINLLGVVLGLALVSLFVSGVALAQTEVAAVSTDIPKELVSLAQDLGCKTSTECALKFDANIEQGIILAQKYDIYTPEQKTLATSFRTEVLERLRTVSQDNFEEEILVLANKILKEKPALAKTMGVTRQTVNAAETVINTIKDAGVDIKTCQKSPENLSREQLIACVKAGNNLSNQGTLVGDYIPKGNAKAGEVEQMLALENSLLAGEYPKLGKISVEEVGQVCLKPGSESIADCDRIAQKFFGNEGVKHLQEARQQTTRIKEYYTGGIEKMELVTPDGKKLIGKGAIKNACDKAFENSNLGLARACGNFAVKNGYATQAEIEDGLKIMETFSQKAGGVNFDDCRFNPESCKEFLPDEFRSQFDSQSEIFRIMSESIGFDPARCENSNDPDIGKRCLEGAKAALSQVEAIAQKSPGARKIVDEIRGHIAEGERMTQRRDEFHEESRAGGNAGPGGCRGPEECFKYCSQAANSAECISFGAKSQIFEQNTVVQKFNMVNEQFNTPQGQPYPYPPQNNNTFPIGQKQDQYSQYPYTSQQQPVGPSPECFAAISSGDFAKAKIVCASTTENYPKPIAEPFPVCPTYAMPSPCPEGQMRQMASDSKNCPAYGACTAIEGYRPIDTPKPCPVGTYWDGRSCIANPEQNITNDQTRIQTSCAFDQWWDPTTQSCKSSAIQPVSSGCGSFTDQTACQVNPGCGWANGACGGNMTTGNTCPSGQYWYYPPAGGAGYCMSSSNTACTSGQYWNGTACVSNSTTDTASMSASCAQAGGTWNSSMMPPCQMPTSTSTACSSGQYWYTPPGGGVGYCQSMSAACAEGGGTWNTSTNYCQMSNTTSSTSCSSGQYWNGSACVSSSNSATTCSFGQYWNGSACVNSTSCPSEQYWNGTACVSNSSTYTSDPSAACAQGGGTWNTSTNYCQMPNTTSSGSTCSSGQYWNGSACVSNSTTPDTTSMSTNCAQAGGSWDGSACQMPTTSSSTPSSTDMSANCAQAGGSWDGSSCIMPPSAMVLCGQAGGSWTGAACNLAENTSDQKDYYNYYQKQSGASLAQVFRAFADLFR